MRPQLSRYFTINLLKTEMSFKKLLIIYFFCNNKMNVFLYSMQRREKFKLLSTIIGVHKHTILEFIKR